MQPAGEERRVPKGSRSQALVPRRTGKALSDAAILQIADDLEPHGQTRAVLDVARAVIGAGGQSVIASRGGALVGEARIAGSEHVLLPPPSVNPVKAMMLLHGLRRIVETHRIDIVHLRTPTPAAAMARLARRAKLHFVSTVSALPEAKCGLLERRRWRAMLGADRVIAISDFIADGLRRTGDIPQARLRVVHRGIDLAHFNPAAVKAQRLIALARRYALPDDKTIILAAGRIVPRKGFDILIDALARLEREDLFCLILGADEADGATTRALERHIEEAGLGGQVRLGGHADDMAAAYMLADVVAVPSREPDAFGRVCVEAQAMGRPVVAFAHGGATETVIEGETGWLAPPGDSAAFAAALARAVDLEPERRRAMALTTRSRVVEHFGRERMCTQVLAIYEELLSS